MRRPVVVLISVAVALRLAAAQPAFAQERVKEEDLLDLFNAQHRAVELYRSGRIDDALAVFERHSVGLSDLLAGRIMAALEEQPLAARFKGKYPVEQVRPWTLPFAASLAALHLESALRTYERRGSIETFRAKARTAAKLFNFLTVMKHPTDRQWGRWMLAIGSLAAGDGEAWWASAILDDGCENTPSMVALLVACGSAHQAIANLPAHALLLGGREPERDEWRALNGRSMQEAVAVSKRHLAVARRSFEAALRIDATDTEARLRLAHLDLIARDTQRGTARLEGFPENTPSDRREAFLGHLFLGALRQQAGQLDAAVALFKRAIDIVPSAQSAHTALAAVLLRSGKASEASDVTARMFDAPSDPPDPWAHFHYGQYWIVDSLLAALRAEARQ